MYMVSIRPRNRRLVCSTSIKRNVALPRFIQGTAKGVGGFLGGAEEKSGKTNDASHRERPWTLKTSLFQFGIYP